MTHIENLRIGNFVAVSCDRERAEDGQPEYGWGFSNRQRDSYSGNPAIIVAISLPFVCVDFIGGPRTSIDIRRYELVKLNRRYALAMAAANCQPTQEKPRKFAENLVGAANGYNDKSCPRCGERPVSLLVAGNSEWKEVCRACNRYI